MPSLIPFSRPSWSVGLLVRSGVFGRVGVPPPFCRLYHASAI
jgi:hypothetical protein